MKHREKKDKKQRLNEQTRACVEKGMKHVPKEKMNLVVESETEEYLEFYTDENNSFYTIILAYIVISSISSICKIWLRNGRILDGGQFLLSMFWDQDCYELASLLLYYMLVINACYIYDSIVINLCSNHPIMVHMMSILFELMTLIYPSIFLWNCTWSFIPRLSVAIQVVVTLLKNYSFLDITYSDSLQYHHQYFYIPILHYVRFHFSPSLVYSNNMPLTQNIRLSYIFQKLMIILLSIFRLYTNVIEYMPLFEQYYRNEISFLYIYIQILPFIYTFFLLIFSMIFLGVCPLFAELTRWPDRRFFSYWWRCTTLSEFSRLWNKPVHLFLYEHIYKPCKINHIPQFWSLLWTYLISALGHEYVLFFSTKKFRPIVSIIILLETPIDVILHYLTNIYPPFSKTFNLLFHLAISFFGACFFLVYLKQ